MDEANNLNHAMQQHGGPSILKEQEFVFNVIANPPRMKPINTSIFR